jgi:hypothetical protein
MSSVLLPDGNLILLLLTITSAYTLFMRQMAEYISIHYKIIDDVLR